MATISITNNYQWKAEVDVTSDNSHYGESSFIEIGETISWEAPEGETLYFEGYFYENEEPLERDFCAFLYNGEKLPRDSDSPTVINTDGTPIPFTIGRVSTSSGSPPAYYFKIESDTPTPTHKTFFGSKGLEGAYIGTKGATKIIVNGDTVYES